SLRPDGEHVGGVSGVWESCLFSTRHLRALACLLNRFWGLPMVLGWLLIVTWLLTAMAVMRLRPLQLPRFFLLTLEAVWIFSAVGIARPRTVTLSTDRQGQFTGLKFDGGIRLFETWNSDAAAVPGETAHNAGLFLVETRQEER